MFVKMRSSGAFDDWPWSRATFAGTRVVREAAAAHGKICTHTGLYKPLLAAHLSQEFTTVDSATPLLDAMLMLYAGHIQSMHMWQYS